MLDLLKKVAFEAVFDGLDVGIVVLDDQDPLCRHSFASLTRRYAA
jgi:hypothetical protein